MTWPTLTSTNNGDPGVMIQSLCQANGLTVSGLSQLAQLQLLVANIMNGGFPATTAIQSGPTVAGSPGAIVAAYGGAAAGAITAADLIKAVTAITDNTATTVLTITVPNTAQSAVVQVTLVGIAGAGGAIGAGEDVTSVSYNISVTRTPGVAMGATASSAIGSAAAAVVGAGTMTCVGAITLTGEGVTLTNTAVFKATIDQSSTSSNHVCLVFARVINANATGITIS